MFFWKRKYKQIRHWIEILHGRYLFHIKVAIPWNARTEGEEFIKIGKDCVFQKHIWLEVIRSPELDRSNKPRLIIGDRVSIEEFVHIGCLTKIEIGNDVLMGSKIYISDHNHGIYSGELQDSPYIPPKQRKLTQGEPIRIGDRVWIGEFVTILPGVTIGEGAIIGAMSVVTHDIPPNTIALGSPARVVKRWDESLKEWVREDNSRA